MLWNVAIPSCDWVFLRLPKSWLFFFRGLGGSDLFGLIAFWYDGHIGRWSINCHGLNLPDQSNFHWLLEILEVLSLFISRWRIASLIRDAMVQAFEYPGGRGMSRHEDADRKDKQYSVAKICLITNTTRHPIDPLTCRLNVHPTYFWCLICLSFIPLIELSMYPVYISLYDSGCHVVRHVSCEHCTSRSFASLWCLTKTQYSEFQLPPQPMTRGWEISTEKSLCQESGVTLETWKILAKNMELEQYPENSIPILTEFGYVFLCVQWQVLVSFLLFRSKSTNCG